LQAFEFGADVAESKTGNETSVASVSRSQAVKNAIKSFVPDRETEAKLIALGLRWNQLIWWASFVAAFVAFGASVYSQHGEDSGPSQSLTFVQFSSLCSTEHALRKVHSQSHFFLFFQDSPNSFLWLSLVLHWFRVLLLFTGPTQSTPFMQKLGRV